MDTTWLVPLVLFAVVGTILWRPGKINEAIPAIVGAAIVIAIGAVTPEDLHSVLQVVSGPGITILSTMMMSAVLDRAGFFHWAAIQLARKADGSGKALFVLTLLLSFLMTMFFNNDGSILITTPIILEITNRLHFAKAQALPYLLGGALIASASSAPIGVSNLANLIALNIVGLNLNQYAELMSVPSLLGLAICAVLLYIVFRQRLPSRYRVSDLSDHAGPPWPGPPLPPPLPRGGLSRPAVPMHTPEVDRSLFAVGIAIVIMVRIGFFVGSYYKLPVQLIAVAGAAVLLGYFATRRPREVWPILKHAPWYIIAFAFGMYTIVFGLHKVGLTTILGQLTKHASGDTLLGYVFVCGILLTFMSCIMNNLPSVMIGTIMLTDLHLHATMLKLSYLANVLGSDIGSLLLPMGTLASLLWFHIVRRKMDISWKDYMKVSFVVIPPSLLIALMALYLWGLFVLA